jgi:hypothetical protein
MDEDTRDSIMNVLVPRREEWECDGGFADFLEGVDSDEGTSDEGVHRGFVFKIESEYDAAIWAINRVLLRLDRHVKQYGELGEYAKAEVLRQLEEEIRTRELSTLQNTKPPSEPF